MLNKETTTKAFIFDMDGTIVDNMHIHDMAWILFLKDQGLIYTKKMLDEVHHGTLVQMMKRIFGNHLSIEECRRLGGLKEKIYRELFIPDLVLIAGLESLLKKIKSTGHKIGMATNAGWPNVDFVLNHTGIRHYFDHIITGHDVEEGKPNPDIFFKSMRALEVLPEDTFIFEDSHAGFTAGFATGAKVIGMETTLSKETLEIYKLHKIIRNYTELNLDEM